MSPQMRLASFGSRGVLLVPRARLCCRGHVERCKLRSSAQGALEALQQMEQSGVRATSVTWTTMVVGFARSSSFQVSGHMCRC